MGTAALTAGAAIACALITADRLVAFAPNMSEDVAAELAPALAAEAALAEVTTPIRVAHFLANVYVETWGLTRFVENLNYSAAGLVAEFPAHFLGQANLGVHPEGYAHNPEAIANRVYANRFGNGDEDSGDGFRYRGRGLLACTFKDNYAEAAEATGLDLVGDPDQLHLPGEAMAKAAFAYWTSRKINAAADEDDAPAVRHLVNGGENGLADALAALKRAKLIFIEPEPEAEAAPPVAA